MISDHADVTEILRISGADPRKCMQCGKCTASCPAFDRMEYPPHRVVAMVRRGEIDALAASPSIWLCLSCFACLERCPRNVEPSKLVEAVRLSVIRRKGISHLRPEAIPEKLDEALPQQAVVAAFRKYNR